MILQILVIKKIVNREGKAASRRVQNSVIIVFLFDRLFRSKEFQMNANIAGA